MENSTATTRRIDPVNKRGGVWILFGEEEYRVPPLGMRDIQDLQSNIAKLAAITGVPTPEQMSIVTNILHKAIKRNYPDITEDAVIDMLDVGNFQIVLNAALAVSGFERGKAGEVVTS